MTNSVPHGSTGAPPLSTYTSNPAGSSAIFRRSSYASVLSGTAPATGAQNLNQPTRSGASPLLMNAGSAPPHPHHYHSSHSRHASRGGEADGIHNSMSGSWGRGGPLPSYASQFGIGAVHGTHYHDPMPTFFVPSYLKGSRHAERLEEAHRARLAAYKDARSAHSSNAGSLSTSSSSANLHKLPSSHRGMAHDIIERVPFHHDEAIAPLPSRWNESDKSSGIDIKGDGSEVRFAGLSKTHDDAATVRADHPMPRQCGIYYWEVTIVSRGKEGLIGIGFQGPKVTLNRLPGWEPESWAYHGDDGYSFCCTASGKPYGPKFSTLDVIGCGVNFRTGCAFFTKNGVNLGIAFKDIKGDRLYPCVGMKKPGEHLKANFGQERFVFDIDGVVKAEQLAIQEEIARTDSQALHPPLSERALIHELIAQYLSHDGYVETARAFAGEVRGELRALQIEGEESLKHLDPEDNIDAINRQKIRFAVLEGDIDKAIKFTRKYYPSVLKENENIYFKLRCRKFIEMIRQCTELQPGVGSHQKCSPSTANGHHASTEDYGVFDSQMELDDEDVSAANVTASAGEWETAMDTEDGDVNTKYQALLSETIQYGQELQAEFAGDPRREVKKALEDTFALIAYPDARESSLAPLLEVSGRTPVAEELNSAILVSLGKSSSAALERLCQQAEALVAELSDEGGAGAFINVRRDFLH